MKLNIVTVLWRKNYILEQYKTIPKKPDINWILCKTNLWGKIPNQILFNTELNTIVLETKIKTKNKTEHITDFVLKINHGLKNVEHGFFYILDDDNSFNNEIYNVFNEYKNSNYKMIIGRQIRNKNGKFLAAQYPKHGCIDMGNVICSTDIFNKVDYFNNINKKNRLYDWQFWLECFNSISKDDVLLLHKNIFNYNGLR